MPGTRDAREEAVGLSYPRLPQTTLDPTPPKGMIATNFTARHRSMLRAIAEGRGQLRSHSHPSLSVDGRWCDFTATNDLVGHNLIQPAFLAPAGRSAPAILTPTGAETLAALSR